MDAPEYAVPSNAFIETLASLPDKYSYILVFHLSKNNLGYLLEWTQRLPVLGVISIPYSEQADVKAEVEKHAAVFSPALEEIPQRIVSLCTENIGKEIVLIEIGGYSAAVSQLLPNVVLTVEATTRGHNNFLEHSQELTHPVVSIALTSGKQQESETVGKAIAMSTIKTLQRAMPLTEKPVIIVLGYGSVGRGAAQYLKELGFTVDVYDPDTQRMGQARSDGFTGQDREVLLANAEAIVGCSGHQSISVEDLPKLKNDVVLISGSSRQVEFPYEEIREQALDSAENGIFESFVVHEKSLNIAYKGQPINFYFDIGLGDGFDVPMTLLAQAAAYGLSGKLAPGVHELPS